MQHILRINWDELNRLHVKIIGDGALLHSPEVYFKELFLSNSPICADIKVIGKAHDSTATPSERLQVVNDGVWWMHVTLLKLI